MASVENILRQFDFYQKSKERIKRVEELKRKLEKQNTLDFFKNQILKSETISESYNIQEESIKLASDSNSNSDVESNINLDTPTNI